MSISLSRYFDITSNLAGQSTVVTRQLIGRFFTGNTLLPVGTFLEFTSASDVGVYFGTSSEEYYRALFYFSWISKENTYPQAIQFARCVLVASAPMIYSIPSQTFSLTVWNAVTSGNLTLTIGAYSTELTGMDFSGADSAAAVAVILQDAIQAVSAGGATWESATVVYNGSGGFTLTGGVASSAAGAISVTASSGDDISVSGLLGWLPAQSQATTYSSAIYLANSIWSPGSDAISITSTLTASADLSNDFGSFAFLNNLSLTTTQITQAALWNNGENVSFMYCVPVTTSNYSAVSTAVNSYNGTQLTLAGILNSSTGVVSSTVTFTGTITNSSNSITNLPSSASSLYIGMPVSGTDIPANTFITNVSIDDSFIVTVTMSNTATDGSTETITFGNGQYPEQFPMMILAATNYLGLNTVQNYMFQQVAGLQSLVTTDSNANTYDADAVNYYGQTQEAGNQISFYQRGLMQGSLVATNITDMTAYANEIWLKDAMGAEIMSLLLAQTQIGANNYGRSLILTVMQGVINQALDNGTISVGKQLNSVQIAYITTATGYADAWYQVQNSGYWVDVVITTIPSSSPTQYQATYTLIYSKDDVIRLVIGEDILI